MKSLIEIGFARVAVEDFRQHLAVRRVLPRFADQNLVGAAGRQAVRQDEPAEPPPTII